MFVILTMIGIQLSSQTHLEDDMIRHLVSCVDVILWRHFTPGTTVLILMMDSQLEHETSSISRRIVGTSSIILEHQIMKTLHDDSNWSFQTFIQPLNNSENYSEDTPTHIEGCIFILNSENNDDMRVEFEQLLFSSYSILIYVDKFIVLSSQIRSKHDIENASKLFQTTWTNIIKIDFIVLFPFVEDNTTSIKIFSWFPFEEKNCGDKLGIVKPIYQWPSSETAKFPDVNFFPTKLPSSFNGCVLTIFSKGIAPYVILNDIKILEDGKTIYDLEGLCIEYLNLFSWKFNFTTRYQKPLITLNNDLQNGTGIEKVS